MRTPLLVCQNPVVTATSEVADARLFVTTVLSARPSARSSQVVSVETPLVTTVRCHRPTSTDGRAPSSPGRVEKARGPVLMARSPVSHPRTASPMASTIAEPK